MLFNATFNNISVLSLRSVSLVGGNRRKSPPCHKSLTNYYRIMLIEYTSLLAGIEITTLVTIGTDCTGSCKSNYHAIMTMTAIQCYR